MAVEAAGVDTWSVGWRVPEGSDTQREMEQRATVRATRSMLLEESVSGHRVGWFPSARMFFVEGHPSEGGLGATRSLSEALERIEGNLREVGLDPGSEVRRDPVDGGWEGRPFLRRLDSTVDLRFGDASEGLAVLAGVAGLPVPRYKTNVYREVGGRRIETVQFRGHSGRNIVGRWYDKGIESGSEERGVRIRPEDQRRFPSGARPLVEDLAESSFVRDSFVRRFQPLWKASKGIKVGSALQLAQRLAELQDEGKISSGEAKAVAGHLLLETARAHRQSDRQVRRDRALGRRHGLVLADGVLEEVEIDLQDVLESALEAEAWGEG